MDLASKLQIRPGQTVAVIDAPESLTPDLPSTAAEDPAAADVVLAFVTSQAEVLTVGAPVIAAAEEDRLAWIAYPKAGQLGTDLNRDRLADTVRAAGAQPVRQIAIDAVWSALRLRPAG